MMFFAAKNAKNRKRVSFAPFRFFRLPILLSIGCVAAEAGPETISPTMIGVWVLAGGMVLSIALNGARFWKSLHGEPERRAVNLLADPATKDEVKNLAAEIRDLDQDVSELRHEMKIDRQALTKAAEERAIVLEKNIREVLSAVSELRGVVDVIRDKTTRTGA